jgi:hypothetical protein
MDGPGWLARPLRRTAARLLGRGRIHQLLWRVSQPVTMRLRSLAARDDEKPSRTGSSSAGWFRACVNRSYPEGIRLLLCASTVWMSKAAPSPGSADQSRLNRGIKRASRPGRTRSLGRTRENLPSAGDSVIGTAGLRTKGNLRGKRPDPSHRANAPSTAVADPALSGKDAYVNRKCVFTWSVSRWRNHWPNRAKRSHSIIP